MDTRHESPSPTRVRARFALAALALVLLVVLAFAPGLSGAWLRWDDDRNFLDHDAWRGLGPDQLRWMVTTFHQGPYQPLSWFTLALDHAVWGLDPFGYHLTNLILHAATAVAFLFLARRVLVAWAERDPTGEPRAGFVLDLAAWCAAAVFALHPLRVESVAWITERRDVLSGLLLVPCVTLYLAAWQDAHADDRRRRRLVAASVALYAASLAAKGLGMTLPVVLLVLDALVLGRFRGAAFVTPRAGPRQGLARLVAEKWAYVLLALVAAGLAWHGQKNHASVVSWADHTLGERVGQSFFGLGYYAAKTVWPAGLTPLLPLPMVIDPFAPRYLAPAIAGIAACAFAWWGRARAPGLLAGLLAYVVFASPVLGMTQAGPQIVADRYAYLPSTALALLVGAGVALLVTRAARRASSPRSVATPAVALAAIVALALVFATRAQCAVWQDTISLWARAASVTPEHPDLRRNLTVAYMRAAEAETAPQRRIEIYERGIAACRPDGAAPTDSGVISNEACMFKALADLVPARRAEFVERARASALEAIRVGEARNQPVPDAYQNHGLLAIELGRTEEALPSFAWLCGHDPANAEYPLMLAQTLLLLGRHREALAPLRRVQLLDPRTPVPWIEAGNAHRALGEIDAARTSYARGIELGRALPPESGITPEVLAEWQRLADALPR